MINLIEKIGSLYNELEKKIIKLMGEKKEVALLDFCEFLYSEKDIKLHIDDKEYILAYIRKETIYLGGREHLVFEFYLKENFSINKINFNLLDLPFDALFLVLVCKRLKEIV